jgi:hypothetical protein
MCVSLDKDHRERLLIFCHLVKCVSSAVHNVNEQHIGESDHEDASQGMYMSKIEKKFLTARILQNQRMLSCGECFHD